MGLHMTLTIRSRSNLTSPMDASDVVSYWCSIHFICLSCSNKVLQATQMWWDWIWPWPLGQGQILASPIDSSGVVSYWCSIHFMCLSCSNKVLQATEMWWYCVWPWPKGQSQTWHHQWIPQMWFPIDVQYNSYVYLAPIRWTGYWNVMVLCMTLT